MEFAAASGRQHRAPTIPDLRGRFECNAALETPGYFIAPPRCRSSMRPAWLPRCAGLTHEQKARGKPRALLHSIRKLNYFLASLPSGVGGAT